MIDAVDSGGYGVLGLYAAQAPVVADPPPASRSTGSPDAPIAAVAAVPEAAAVGSEPVAAADAGQEGAQTGGRRYADEGQAGARQAAVAASLATATAASGTTGGSVAASEQTPAASTGRTLRAYSRSGQGTGSASRGAMLTATV